MHIQLSHPYSSRLNALQTSSSEMALSHRLWQLNPSSMSLVETLFVANLHVNMSGSQFIDRLLVPYLDSVGNTNDNDTCDMQNGNAQFLEGTRYVHLVMLYSMHVRCTI